MADVSTEFPFDYWPNKDYVRIRMYEHSDHPDISGSHAEYIVKPDGKVFNVSFEMLRAARSGIIAIDGDRQHAEIVKVFDK
ncbi:MAG: hypothetical protein AAF213_03035 [Pseudomonadota bacterium]